MEEGILTLEQEQKLSVMVDEALKFKGILEFVDGYVAKVVITLLDDKVVDKLKEDIKVQLAALVDAAMDGNIELSETIAADIVNGLVDIPGLDETSEGLIFKGAIELAVGAVLNWIAKAKEEPVVLKLA
jgi:hypothetical protein